MARRRRRPDKHVHDMHAVTTSVWGTVRRSWRGAKRVVGELCDRSRSGTSPYGFVGLVGVLVACLYMAVGLHAVAMATAQTCLVAFTMATMTRSTYRPLFEVAVPHVLLGLVALPWQLALLHLLPLSSNAAFCLALAAMLVIATMIICMEIGPDFSLFRLRHFVFLLSWTVYSAVALASAQLRFYAGSVLVAYLIVQMSMGLTMHLNGTRIGVIGRVLLSHSGSFLEVPHSIVGSVSVCALFSAWIHALLTLHPDELSWTTYICSTWIAPMAVGLASCLLPSHDPESLISMFPFVGGNFRHRLETRMMNGAYLWIGSLLGAFTHSDPVLHHLQLLTVCMMLFLLPRFVALVLAEQNGRHLFSRLAHRAVSLPSVASLAALPFCVLIILAAYALYSYLMSSTPGPTLPSIVLQLGCVGFLGFGAALVSVLRQPMARLIAVLPMYRASAIDGGRLDSDSLHVFWLATPAGLRALLRQPIARVLQRYWRKRKSCKCRQCLEYGCFARLHILPCSTEEVDRLRVVGQITRQRPVPSLANACVSVVWKKRQQASWPKLLAELPCDVQDRLVGAQADVPDDWAELPRDLVNARVVPVSIDTHALPLRFSIIVLALAFMPFRFPEAPMADQCPAYHSVGQLFLHIGVRAALVPVVAAARALAALLILALAHPQARAVLAILMMHLSLRLTHLITRAWHVIACAAAGLLYMLLDIDIPYWALTGYAALASLTCLRYWELVYFLRQVRGSDTATIRWYPTRLPRPPPAPAVDSDTDEDTEEETEEDTEEEWEQWPDNTFD